MSDLMAPDSLKCELPSSKVAMLPELLRISLHMIVFSLRHLDKNQQTNLEHKV